MNDSNATSHNGSQAFATVSILLTALVYIGFAVWLGSNPRALLVAFEIEQSTPQMLTEIRAFYGGIELAIAAAMLLLWWRGELFAAALIGGLPLVGSVAGRLMGQVVDGYSAMHLGLAVPEAIGAAVCLAACWLQAATRFRCGRSTNRPSATS